MVDGYNLAANSMWIFGLALLLAVLGYARWEAITGKSKLKVIIDKSFYQAMVTIAGILFFGGLTATSDHLWKLVFWLVMLSLFSVRLFVLLSSKEWPQH